MDYIIIVDKIFLRIKPFFQSKYYNVLLSFGQTVYSEYIIKRSPGDFTYAKVTTHNITGFIPLEYLIERSSPLYLQYKDLHIVPSSLKAVPCKFTNNRKIYVTNSVFNNLLSLLENASKDNINITIIKGYLSAKELSKLYKLQYEALFMQNKIEKPFYSIYHSGDIISVSTDTINYQISHAFYLTKAYDWLLLNAYLYGFKVDTPDTYTHYKDINNWKPWQLLKYNNNPHTKEKTRSYSNTSSSLFMINNILCVAKEVNTNLKNNLKYITLHHNEITAAQTLSYALKTYGGTAFRILNNYKRNIIMQLQEECIYFDPNRIFLEGNLTTHLAELNQNTRTSTLEVAADIVSLISRQLIALIDTIPSDIFISLHTNNHISNFSVHSFKDISSFETRYNPKHNPKNFFYTTDKDIFSFLSSKDTNVVLQKEYIMCNDGSLSIFMHRKNIKFVTIESQEGYDLVQRNMIDLLMIFISNTLLIKSNE